MDDEQLRAAVAQVAGRAELEASGGVTLQTLRAIARRPGVEWVSMGALTHSAPALDLSLLLELALASAHARHVTRARRTRARTRAARDRIEEMALTLPMAPSQAAPAGSRPRRSPRCRPRCASWRPSATR